MKVKMKMEEFMSNLKNLSGDEKYNQFRSLYPEFIYQGYHIEKKEKAVGITYDFLIRGVTEFHPTWEFPYSFYDANTEQALKRLVFSLGMVELISYWKAICPPKVVIACGSLTKEQAAWWKKLYYHGLGEFFYVNGICADEKSFIELEYTEQQESPVLLNAEDYKGCLVPIGGGKDSVASLEILKCCPDIDITTFSVNRIEAVQKVIELCSEKTGDICVRRTLDSGLLELNRQGYLNGHTPFSAIVAFASAITALLNGKRYITLSNETSANESTVRGSTVNHQYSKSFEFEKDFCWYLATLIDAPIHYFSLLRPLTELQIAKIFAGAKKYHSVFRSCNAGSKKGVWCCECSKCLFVYIILSPFLSVEELVEIFGENLLEKESMETYFRELSGIDENKPFECVGTRGEVVAVLKDLLKKEKTPLLAERYRDWLEKQEGSIEELLAQWCAEHDVPEPFIIYIKEKLYEK